jgi:hypothetical protein
MYKIFENTNVQKRGKSDKTKIGFRIIVVRGVHIVYKSRIFWNSGDFQLNMAERAPNSRDRAGFRKPVCSCFPFSSWLNRGIG